LSIPYNFYNGALKREVNPSKEAVKSNENLKRFVSYLETLQSEQPELVTFDLVTLKNDVSSGMFFDSSIPQGYGVGSSGALVAAIYDKYAQHKITVLENLTREKLLKLKMIFGQMESFFHGKSSGLEVSQTDSVITINERYILLLIEDTVLATIDASNKYTFYINKGDTSIMVADYKHINSLVGDTVYSTKTFIGIKQK
jgi:mevalonate kinase